MLMIKYILLTFKGTELLLFICQKYYEKEKNVKKILVCGAGGFIGGAMVKRLKQEGCWVRGVDIKAHEFSNMDELADEFLLGDLRDPKIADAAASGGIDEIYQFAADMGGAGYIFTGENDADIMHNSVSINLNVQEVFFLSPLIYFKLKFRLSF